MANTILNINNTKLLILICLFSIVQFKVVAQPYRPFPSSGNAQWIVSHHESLCPGDIDFQYTYYLNGDTVINSQNYSKLFVKLSIAQCQLYNEALHLRYGIRNDTLARKVFVYDFGTQQEDLLYDFDLQVGDTLPPCYFYNQPNSPQIVDSIFIDTLQDGSLTRAFYFTPGGGLHQNYLYEGIGSSFGLIESFVEGQGEYNSLECFSILDTTVYGYIPNCTSLYLETNDEPTKTINVIYDNRNQNLILSDFDDNPLVKFYSYNGQCIQTIKIDFLQKTAVVSTKALSEGFYIIYIIQNQNLTIKKIIK